MYFSKTFQPQIPIEYVQCLEGWWMVNNQETYSVVTKSFASFCSVSFFVTLKFLTFCLYFFVFDVPESDMLEMH